MDLPPSAVLVLKEHRDRQEAVHLMTGSTLKENDLVFSQMDGRPLLPDTVSHAWTRLAKRLGKPDICLQDARHSHASLTLKQGIRPKIVQERLGHASIQTTLDICGHAVPGLRQAAAARFDEGLAIRQEDEFKDEAAEEVR